MRFARGNVVKIVNSPPLPKRAPGLGAGRRQAICWRSLDPLSAALIQAKDPRSVCGRTLKALRRRDPRRPRADLRQLQAPVSIDGYEGEAVTCRGRFMPVAGYHRGNKSLQYLSTKSRIMLKFAQLGKTGIYAPIHATIGTKIGTVTISARRIETSR